MSDEFSVGMAGFQPGNLFQAEYFMYHAGTIPENHITTSDLVDIGPKVFIRRKNDLLVFWKTFNDDFGITACNDHITQGLNAGAAVDIAHYHMIRMLLFEFFEKRRRTTIAERTTCLKIRNHYFFARVKDFSCFGHEVNTSENDHICTGLFSLLSQSQAIPDIIRHILDIRFLVVMRKQNSILLLFEPFNLSKKVKRWIQFHIEEAILIHMGFCILQSFCLHLVLFDRGSNIPTPFPIFQKHFSPAPSLNTNSNKYNFYKKAYYYYGCELVENNFYKISQSLLSTFKTRKFTYCFHASTEFQ